MKSTQKRKKRAISALFYFAKGYKKDCAKYYRLVFRIFAVSYIIETFLLYFESEPILLKDYAIWLTLMLFLYGNNVVLGVAKDIGKRASLGMCIFMIICAIGSLIYYLLVPGTTTARILISASWLSSAIVSLIMTVAKYIDKANRNTK